MTGIRNRALIAVLYRTGLRITEALSLYPKDISMKTGVVRVLHGKGDKARTVGIDKGAIECIERWLDVRQKIEGYLLAPLFCTCLRSERNEQERLVPRRSSVRA
jgi:integrase/recombinase XerD